MSSYTVTTPETSVTLRPSSVKRGETAVGTANYSVTNKSGTTKRTALRVKPKEGAESAWFTVRDGEERDIAPGATENFSVDLKVPGGGAKYSFSVVAVNLADTDNDHEAGPAVEFDTPAVIASRRDVKWWMIAAPAALVLVVGGAIAWFITRNGDDPPIAESVILADFAGSAITVEAAIEALAAQNITPVLDDPDTEPEFRWQKFHQRIVVRQDPPSDGTLEIKPSQPVTLGWEWVPIEVTVPDVTGKDFGAAVVEVEAAGLRYIGSEPAGDPPSPSHVPVVASVYPTGKRPAGDGVTFTMMWKEERRNILGVRELQQEFVLNHATTSKILFQLVPPGTNED